jgi:hypothetical protein
MTLGPFMNIPFGTLHIALCGRQRIVVCSDSRGHSRSGPSGDVFNKLFQAGQRTLCATSGVLMLSPDVYVASRVARICAEVRLQDSPRELLSAIRDDMHRPLVDLFTKNPLPDDLPSVFSAFSIRRSRNGEIDILNLDFPVVTGSDGRRLLGKPTTISQLEGLRPPGRFVYHHSRGDCLPKDLNQMVDPDLPDNIVLVAVDAIFESARASTQSCRDEIGGPIDVAAIDSNGFRWLRRKPIFL